MPYSNKHKKEQIYITSQTRDICSFSLNSAISSPEQYDLICDHARQCHCDMKYWRQEVSIIGLYRDTLILYRDSHTITNADIM